MSQAANEQAGTEAPKPQKVKVGPVEVKVVVTIESPDPGGGDDVTEPKGGLAPKKKRVLLSSD